MSETTPLAEQGTANTTCWHPERDLEGDQDGWDCQTGPAYLTMRDRKLLLQLPDTHRGAVNGLAVISGLQVVAPGDLVYVEGPDQEPTEFVVGRITTQIESGDGRVCDFCGLPIVGEAIRCPCGKLFCAELRKKYRTCPLGGEPLDAADGPPSEELL